MKKTLILFILMVCSFQVHSQFMQILRTQTTTIANGINVNLQTGTGHGAGLLSHSYTIAGNVIDINVCYWFNNTLPILYFTHNFFIPLSNSGNYTINIHILMSQSTEVCDNFANPANTTIAYSFLSTPQNELIDISIYPNPTSGVVYFDGLDANVNRVEVFDLLGKRIKNEMSFSKKLDLSNLPNGIYLIKVQTTEGMINKKIVIEK